MLLPVVRYLFYCKASALVICELKDYLLTCLGQQVGKPRSLCDTRSVRLWWLSFQLQNVRPTALLANCLESGDYSICVWITFTDSLGDSNTTVIRCRDFLVASSTFCLNMHHATINIADKRYCSSVRTTALSILERVNFRYLIGL